MQRVWVTAQKRGKMVSEKKLFGTTQDGKEIYLYTLENRNGMKAVVMNYGANLVQLWVPDKNGKTDDVVLGFDKPEDYFENGCFFGATVGPNANRIANASFVLDGETYPLKANDGTNNLHSDENYGYHKQVWNVETTDDSVIFIMEMEDGKLGFPGNKRNTVTYTLTADNELKIHYTVTTDKRTIVNLTNHTYFNLSGEGNGDILEHKLKLYSSKYTPVVKGSIPTGEIADVAGTPMDFREFKAVGKDINADFEQLALTGGYDHNWVIDNWNKTLQLFAEVEDEKSGRKMYAYTDLPGFQFYAGNFVEGEKGKNGHVYYGRSGLCLETQFYPNTANEPSFPSAVFGPEKPYESTTVYRFA